MKSTNPPIDPPQENPASIAEPPAGVQDAEVLISNEADNAVVDAGDAADFKTLDLVVRDGLKTFIRVGHALMQIRQRELWRAGGHASWDAYSHAVGGFTRIHANRLINAAEIAGHLAQVKPIGFTTYLLPQAESQVRPLCRLKDPEKQVTAWSRAIQRADGQPTAKLITDVVAELMAEEQAPAESKPSRKECLIEVINRISTAVLGGKPKKEIEGVITELKKMLRLD